MRIVLLGPPGSGKGTQAVRLARRLGVAHVASGEILRANTAEGTRLSRTVRQHMHRGELVPDDIVLALVMERIARPDCRPGFVLDGFPRSVAQAVALDRALDPLGTSLEVALSFDVAQAELLQRLAGRSRADDHAQSIRNRLRVFATATPPLLDYYSHRGVLIRVDASGGVDEVSQRIQACLDRLATQPGSGGPGR
jgi:adenylate kinase